MALDTFLLELLVDPLDHESLVYLASKDLLVNPRRRVAYQVVDNIAVLLPDEARALSDEELNGYLADPEAQATGQRYTY